MTFTKNNQFLLTLFLLFCFVFTNAQDKILLKSGEEIYANITSETDSLLEYSTNTNGEILNSTVRKNLIRSITYKSDHKGEPNRRGRRYVILKLTNGKQIRGHVKSEKEKELEVYTYIDGSYSNITLDKVDIKEWHFYYDYPIYTTVGLLKGGGSLVGLDIEAAIGSTSSIHLGIGYLGWGFGINNYFKHVSHGFGLRAAYYHQGIQSTFAQSFVGGSIIYKSSGGLSSEFGLGRILKTSGRAGTQPKDIILIYSIGYCFPNSRTKR